jgi:tetratricopeptide (TPR) repeat protein
MLLYLAGWAKGDPKLFEIASKQSPELCFPNRLEEMLALQAATHVNPEDGAAWYLLGNFLFSRKRYDEAIAAWEKAVALLPTYPTAYRNLALAYFNKKHDPQGAAAMLEKAFALDKTDARVLFELDQLYKKLNRSPRERLQLLERHPSLVEARDDLFIEHTTLLNLLGEHEIVQQRLANRQFHPWEGGEGKVTGNYVYSLLSLARKYLQHGQHEMALTAIDKARVYPHNLGEGKLPGAMENDLDYFAGIALEAMGRSDEAAMLFRRASEGLEEPVSAMFYNDQPPHMIFYQGLAQRRIGIESGALRRFQKLIDYGQKHLHDHVTIDYFAVSLPEFLVFEDDLDKRNEIHCRYMMALGYIGMGEIAAAQAQLEQVLSMDSSHAGAAFHRELLNSKLL